MIFYSFSDCLVYELVELLAGGQSGLDACQGLVDVALVLFCREEDVGFELHCEASLALGDLLLDGFELVDEGWAQSELLVV